MIPLKPPSSIRLLCAADLHIGRVVTSALEDKSKENYVLQAWANFVALATAPSSSIDAVLLAGDIFDSEDNLYEAAYQFEKGVMEISKRGIPVFAVAGNHDAHLFIKRSYFSHLPSFRLLGKNGTWESHYQSFGQRKLRIDGWSFPDERYAGNPLQTSRPCERDEMAVGLLHCDSPGSKESVYAPVSPSDFAKTGHRAWILGHIHIPQQILEQPHVFYCGSLQGLDSSEHGFRGAMVLDLSSTGEVSRHFYPLAPLLWHRQAIEVDSSLDLHQILERSAQETFKEDLFCTREIAAAFILQGRVRDYLAFSKRAQELKGEHLTSILREQTLIPCQVEKIIIDCEPAFDLSLLAQGEDLISQLARRLLELQNGGIDNALLQKARTSFEQKVLKYPHLAPKEPMPDEKIRAECLRAGFALLADLIKQKEVVR